MGALSCFRGGSPAILVVLALLRVPPALAGPEVASNGETLGQSLCRLIDASSHKEQLPTDFFTRLIWQESSFRPDATSRAGAQGVAQFMPGTARERGLADPFDPEQAIPAAAGFISELKRRFGNLGLAAAAYNGGPNRVAAWLSGQGGLPTETRDYVARITGKSVEAWAAEREKPDGAGAATGPAQSCLQVTAELKIRPGRNSVLAQSAIAPWGVQLAGNFSKSLALAAYARSRLRLAAVLGNAQPMILGSRLRARGSVTFYRVRMPASTRAEADRLCERIRSVGGACAVLRT